MDHKINHSTIIQIDGFNPLDQSTLTEKGERRRVRNHTHLARFLLLYHRHCRGSNRLWPGESGSRGYQRTARLTDKDNLQKIKSDFLALMKVKS